MTPAVSFVRERVLPVLAVVAALLVVWHVFVVVLNMPFERDQAARAGVSPGLAEIVPRTFAQARPVLPAPHQIVAELWETTIDKAVTSKRSLVYHAAVTLSVTVAGFVIGSLLGVALAAAMVHSRVLDRSLMPWVIASQTVPIIAIAPMVIVVLNAVGISGLLPKAMISAYLSFFPVAVGTAKGLRSADGLLLDLMRTYDAGRAEVFRKLRWPSALPYVFASLKVAVAAALVGAIVSELPTGAVAGLGARLLSGSYYGQTVQIWAALVMTAILGAALVALVGFAHAAVFRRMEGR